jgi:hypothetical protein
MIYLAEMNEMLKKAQAGGSVIGREQIWSLAFADDLIIVAKSERKRGRVKRMSGTGLEWKENRTCKHSMKLPRIRHISER